MSHKARMRLRRHEATKPGPGEISPGPRRHEESRLSEYPATIESNVYLAAIEALHRKCDRGHVSFRRTMVDLIGQRIGRTMLEQIVMNELERKEEMARKARTPRGVRPGAGRR